MKIFKSTILPIFAATIWISISEFIRNELLFKSYWINHYQNLGLKFPSDAINGIVWGVWSLCFAITIFILSKKYYLFQTFLFSFFIGFVMMWLVIGNLGVLPYQLLLFAIPLALIESFVASYIIKKLKL